MPAAAAVGGEHGDAIAGSELAGERVQRRQHERERGRASGTAAFTLVLPALHALAGQLAPGDRVSVIATYGSGSGQAWTKAIARGLEVLWVGGAPSGIDSAAASVPITLALPDPSLASALALANSDAKLDLLRESGGARAAPMPPASEGP